jgi:MFS family permease
LLWASFCYGMLFGSLSPVLAADCEGADDQPATCPECFNCDMGLSQQQLSLWILIGPLPTVLLGPLGGAALDRLGHRWMIVVGGLIYVVGWAALALTPGPRGIWRGQEETNLEQSWVAVLFIFSGRLLSWGGFALAAGVVAVGRRAIKRRPPLERAQSHL